MLHRSGELGGIASGSIHGKLRPPASPDTESVRIWLKGACMSYGNLKVAPIGNVRQRAG